MKQQRPRESQQQQQQLVPALLRVKGMWAAAVAALPLATRRMSQLLLGPLLAALLTLTVKEAVQLPGHLLLLLLLLLPASH
jgi:hypothetical protein